LTITSENITAHELTGLPVRVEASPDPTLKGISGTVKDETKNTIMVESGRRLLRISKDKASFSFQLPTGNWVRIEGAKIRFRPEDRVKRGTAKW
jgi:ribonuclease P protein subunit POP4